MICGALQTLNEEAFEDVVASERPSPTGGPSTGEAIALTPIQETAENDRSLAYSNDGTTDRLQLHNISFSTNISSLNSISNNNSHNFSVSNSNKGNHNSMVADYDQTNNTNMINNNRLMDNNMSGLNVHEQLPPTATQSHITNPTNPPCSASITLEHDSMSIDHCNDNNHTAISITTSTPQPSSTIILMPDAKTIGTEPKPSIDDTRL